MPEVIYLGICSWSQQLIGDNQYQQLLGDDFAGEPTPNLRCTPKLLLPRDRHIALEIDNL
jgi:hypothetical protein